MRNITSDQYHLTTRPEALLPGYSQLARNDNTLIVEQNGVVFTARARSAYVEALGQ